MSDLGRMTGTMLYGSGSYKSDWIFIWIFAYLLSELISKLRIKTLDLIVYNR